MPDVLTLAALRALVAFSDPRISPDANRVAYVRETRDLAADKRPRALVVARADGGPARVLDPGPELSSPRWSPDGTRLAYLRHSRRQDADEIVVVAAGGGAPRQITTVKNGVQQFAWSPDGRRFAYVTPDDPPNAAAAKRHDDLFEIRNDGILIDGPVPPSHLWLVGADGRGTRRLTSGSWSVFEGVTPFVGSPSDPSWSPDGRTIAFARIADTQTASTERTRIATVDVASGAVRDLGPHTYVYLPSFAPTGATLAYQQPVGPGPVTAAHAFVVGRDGGEPADRSAGLDRDLTVLRWGADGRLYGLANDAGRVGLWRLGRDAAARVDLGGLSPTDFSTARDGSVAFVGSRSDRAPEVYLARPGAAPRALSRDNAALDRLRYGRVEVVTWRASDGEVSDGLLVHPVGEVPGRPVPLLLYLHGGPEAANADVYDEGTDEGTPQGQLGAARGWAVFLPNYRGSDDRGSAHEHGIFGDPGEGPARDVLAGLDAIASRVAIDPHRVAIAGHSYGGYMSAWLLGHDARWRAGFVGDGAVDLTLGYALSGTGNLAFVRDSIGGTPADPKVAERYRTGSPLAYAGNIHAPTLIITGLRDEVVPYPESWLLYHAIVDHGGRARLIGIPTAHHTPGDPVRLEAYERTVFDWFAGFLR